ncbi:hypothetical protein HCN44_005259 [Aphidius gifuensis]|uniref:Nucleoporin Nup159/Nup146 N-terminal domain-containing protein n=1 Tax=Aphidius gifuensis TaxID=684658 RepID=A0A834Y560_APHGI|nr:nuclear pore complex protein Nup214 [Aphidius gifuensis]KAF7996982.1 hypothetical protein HCN44_005259 [Aphidius gifuensis]
MIKIAPNPVDYKEFQFKQSSLRNVSDNIQNIPFGCNLIASDDKRGLLYIGNNNKLMVVKCHDNGTNENWKHEHQLPQQIARISLSCDNTYIGVTFSRSTAQIFSASSITKNNLELLHEIQLSSFNQNVFGYDLRWNPVIPGMFCTIASDHCIGSFAIKVEQKAKVGVVAMENIQGIDAMCVAWSPKGKQLVVGCKNGSIVQLKPELKVARTITGPTPAIGEIVAIVWITNYQFCAAYANVNERQINVCIVDAPKGETKGIYTAYDDITYGMVEPGGDWYPRYYFEFVPEWNIIITASGNSSEIAILGSSDKGVTWVSWALQEGSVAQLPVRAIENFPVGLTIDKSSEILLPYNDDFLPHSMPILHILCTTGQLLGYHMVNLLPNTPSLCTPPSEPLTITPPPRMSILPTELSFSISAASTPRAKQNFDTEKPKTLPATNLFGQSQKPITTMPISIQQNQQVQQPQPTQQTRQTQQSLQSQYIQQFQQPQISTVPAPKNELKIPNPRMEKIETQPPPPPPSAPSIVKENPPAASKTLDKASVDKVCHRAFVEEYKNFEKELKTKIHNLSIQCGTEEEKKILTSQTAVIEAFLRELRETTNGLVSDVAYLNGLLYQSLAWIEEIKSRNSASPNENTRDRHDRSKIKELQRSYCHTQNLLVQAMKALDMEWIEYQSREKSKLKIPNLEFIYQSLKKHSEIIAHEKTEIENIIKKWNTLKRGNEVSSLNQSMTKLNLTKSPNLTDTRLTGEIGMIKARCQTIANNTKNFNNNKQNKLRSLMMQTKPKVIKVINPSPVQDRLEKALSSLATLSPLPPSSQQKTIKTLSSVSELSKINSTQVLNTNTNTNTNRINSTHTVKLTSKPVNISVQPTLSAAATSAQKSNVQNSLTSLENMVPKISTTVDSQTLNTGRSIASTITTLSPPFGNSPKPNQSMQFSVKNLSQSSCLPTIQTPTSTAFSKGLPISFGSSEPPKHQENFGSTVSKDINQKTDLTFGIKESGTSQNSSSNIFSSDNIFKTSLPPGMTISKVEVPAQSQPTSILATSLSSVIKETTTPTSKPTIFSFSSNSQPVATSKPIITKTETLPSFSFTPKSTGDTSVFSFASNSTPVSSSTNQSQSQTLNLTGLSMGLTDKSISQPQSTTMTTTTTTTTTIFGKTTVSSTPSVLPLQQTKTTAPLPSGISIEKNQTNIQSVSTGALASPVIPSPFGDGTSTANTPVSKPTNIFATATAAAATTTTTTTTTITTGALSSSIFGGISSNTPTTTSVTSPFGASTTTAVPATTNSSIFGGSPSFSQSTVSTPATTSTSTVFSSSSFSSMLNNSMSNITFGQPPTTTTTTNATTGSLIKDTPSNIFGGATQNNVATGSIFGSVPATPSTGIFGGALNTNAPQSSSIFGGSVSTPATNVNTPQSGSIFGSNTPSLAPSVFGTPSSVPTSSIFGGGSGNSFQKPATNVFGGAPAFGSAPVMQPLSPGSTSTFGGAPAFGSKPVFGSPVAFGASDNTFGGSTFGSSASFGSQPVLGGGSSMGSSTFEALAGQNNGGLSFGSLAQKSPEKPPQFSGGTSFSSWR